MKKQKRKNRQIIVILGMLVWGFLIQPPGVAYADDTVQAGVMPYSYDAAGEIDPFEPFIDLNKGKKESKSGKAENQEFLPPLQRYNIEEFKLVAIAGNSTRKVAIVENSKGKSYLLYRNTPIGMNEGRVVGIDDTQVIIMEQVRDAAGKISPRRVVLKLMKYDIEGDK